MNIEQETQLVRMCEVLEKKDEIWWWQQNHRRWKKENECNIGWKRCGNSQVDTKPLLYDKLVIRC